MRELREDSVARLVDDAHDRQAAAPQLPCAAPQSQPRRGNRMSAQQAHTRAGVKTSETQRGLSHMASRWSRARSRPTSIVTPTPPHPALPPAALWRQSSGGPGGAPRQRPSSSVAAPSSPEVGSSIKTTEGMATWHGIVAYGACVEGGWGREQPGASNARASVLVYFDTKHVAVVCIDIVIITCCLDSKARHGAVPPPPLPQEPQLATSSMPMLTRFFWPPLTPRFSGEPTRSFWMCASPWVDEANTTKGKCQRFGLIRCAP